MSASELNASSPAISRWRGVFANPQIEDSYRHQSAALDSIHTARGLLILSVANIIFFLGDLEVLVESDILVQMALSRGSFLILGIVAFIVLRRNSGPELLDRTILLYGLPATALMTFQLVTYVQFASVPPELFGVMLTYLIVVSATWLLLANPLGLQLMISTAIVFSLVIVLQYDIPKMDEQLPFAITFMVLVNLIGMTTSSRRHEIHRQAWWLLSEERSARKSLESEIRLRKSLEQELRHLATTDELTGISNRRHFYANAEAEFKRTQRYGRNLTVLQFDLDFFKTINDNCGHPFGDEVLKAVVVAVNELLRASDLFGRVGGEEFAIALPEADQTKAPEIAERIRQAIEDIDIRFDDNRVKVTASIGVAQLKSEDEDIEAIIGRADQALYQAKDMGRNQVILAA